MAGPETYQPNQADISIPANPDEITPDWLTRALRSTNTIHHARVISIAPPQHVEIQGATGPVVMLRLDYDTYEEGAPESLIAKMPLADYEMRVELSNRGFYLREIRFYQEIAGTVEVGTPKHYYSAMNVDTHEYILLMEDLSHSRVGDHVQGCTVEEIEIAIRSIAALHAGYWDNAKLCELDWLPKMGSRPSPFHQLWPMLVQKFGNVIPAHLLDVGGKFGDRFASKLAELASSPITIIHGDFRPDNFLFRNDKKGPFPLAIVDWQVIRQGRGMIDIAYLIGWCVDTALRRRIERDMLKIYHESLEEKGVIGYSIDQCIQDYRISLLHPFQVALYGFSQLDFTSQRRRELVRVALQRLSASFEDHNVAGLFER